MRDEDVVRQYVENVARLLADVGFPRMAGRVMMAVMTAEEDALTAADLADRLGVSPAAISGAVQTLVSLKLIIREPVPGSRRDRYRIPDDAWYASSATKSALVKTLMDMSDEALPALGGPDTKAGARIAEMSEFFEFALAEMDTLLDRWLAAKAQRAREAAEADLVA